MAENSRGQNKKNASKNRNLQTNSDDLNAGSKHQISTNRGIADLDSGPSIGSNVRKRGSGISTKKSVTGSDFDGQTSTE